MEKERNKPKWMSLKWEKEDIEIAIMMLIALYVAVSIFTNWISGVDFKKATDEDWERLYEQAQVIQKESVLNDEDINVEIKLESEECMLMLKKEENSKVFEIIESDKAIPIVKAIVLTPLKLVASAIMGYTALYLEVVMYSVIKGFWPKKLKRRGA